MKNITIKIALMIVIVATALFVIFEKTTLFADKGMLRITSEPGGAMVFIDGERKGDIPSQAGQSFAIKLPSGEHRVELK